MPTYAYECQKCRKQYDIQESIGEHARHPPHFCPQCGSAEARQLIIKVHVKTSRKS